jgi:hypothetical protein
LCFFGAEAATWLQYLSQLHTLNSNVGRRTKERALRAAGWQPRAFLDAVTEIGLGFAFSDLTLLESSADAVLYLAEGQDGAGDESCSLYGRPSLSGNGAGKKVCHDTDFSRELL